MRLWQFELGMAGAVLVGWPVIFTLLHQIYWLLDGKVRPISEFEWGGVTAMVMFQLFRALQAAIPVPPPAMRPRKAWLRYAGPIT